MSIKYELSLWRDYPGSTGIREEKIDILAATGMDFAGRAQNIKLKKEYTGKYTLEFEIPVKYIDPLSGATIINPLCKKVIEKTKIKLWRDEYWWNPFGGEATYDEETGCTKYAGQWTKGRWYDLVVNSHKEKRSKKQLYYSYVCNSLFMDELARNGYTLQFVPNTDVMSSNGMGTAHDLAARIVKGTDWEYVKTEVFPDYKEEFNAVTGETVKIPVSTDQVEFSSGLDRYCYCYEIDGISSIKNDLLANIENQLKNLKIDNMVTEGTHYGVDNNKFWWRTRAEDVKKDYIWGHLKTDISVNSATTLCSIDSSAMTYNNGTENKPTGATTFIDGINTWQRIQGTINLSSISSGSLDSKENFVSYMQLTPVNNKSTILFRGAEQAPLVQGDVYCVQCSTKVNSSPTIKLWDAKAANYQEVINKNYENIEPIFSCELTATNTANAFENTYWFIVPDYVGQPHFTLHWEGKQTVDVQSIYIYQFKGYNKEVESWLSAARAKKNTIYGKISELNLSQSGVTFNLTSNLMTNEGQTTAIWLGFGQITSEGYQQETYEYPIEFYANGTYYNVYLPLNNKGLTITKISSYKADKRRQISGEKSNRYSLLETVAKTFQCFTRFLVEHDEQGRLKLDNYGRPIKRFTYVSELGRRNFNGFNYGVNLDSVERNVDANNLVSKCHVESISNQYNESNLVSIQESKYNKLGLTFIYNFSYYILMGLLDKERFLKDYQSMVDYINIRTQQNLTNMEVYASQVAKQSSLETTIETNKLLLNSYRTEAQEALDMIAWDRFLDGTDGYLGHRVKGTPDSNYQFPTINWQALKNYDTNNNRQWFGYQDNKVIAATSEADCRSKGVEPTCTGFYTRHELAMYMALNIVGSVNKGFSRPTSVPSHESQFWAHGLGVDAVENQLMTIAALQDRYKQVNITIENLTAELKEINKDVDKYRQGLDKNTKEINQKIEWFEQKYRQFITEGQWQGNDYIDADAYYLDATRAQSEACMPKVSYSIGAMDLSRITNPFNPEDTDWGKEFTYDVGDTSYIKDEELFGNTEQLTMIATITSYIDLDKQDDIEMRNYETRFEELFQSVAAAVTSLQLNENIWGRAANFSADGTIDESILQASFTNNKNLVIASVNNTVTQDNRGITVKDNDTGKITRLIGGGIFFSSDGGNSFKLGITPEGMNASLITAGQIDTSKIVIRNTDTPLFELNSQGLTANRPINGSFTRFDQFGIYSTDQGGRFGKNWWTIQTKPEEYIIANSIFSLTRLGLNFRYEKENLTFGTIGENEYGLLITNDKKEIKVKITNSGDAVFSGIIRAGQGDIGGWKIHDNYLGTDWGGVKDVMFISQKGVSAYINNVGSKDCIFYSKGNFAVTTAGHLYANWGKIGGWNINENILYAKPAQGEGTGFMMGTGTGTNPAFYAGYNSDNEVGKPGVNLGINGKFPTASVDWVDYDIVKFLIDQKGNLSTAGSVEIQGSLNVGRPSYKGGEWKLSFDPSTQKLIVKGDIYADNGYFKGDITGARGTLGGWNINSNSLTYGTFGSRYSIHLYPKGNGSGTINGYNFNDWQLTIGSNFGVDSYGYLYAKGAKFQGRIEADSILQDGVKVGTSGNTGFSDYSNVSTTWYHRDNGNGAGPRITMYNSYIQILGHSGTSMNIGGTGELFGDWYGTEAIAILSDRNLKHDISTLSDQYSILFDNLNPVIYKYNHGTSDRLHTGFIAQEVQEALDIASIDSKDFAGLVIRNRDTEKESWSLRYEEFIALNTWQIQKLKARATKLEARVAELEAKLADLTSF